ncbi:4062_t:CDS:2, partial [Paraglomus occultum]
PTGAIIRETLPLKGIFPSHSSTVLITIRHYRRKRQIDTSNEPSPPLPPSTPTPVIQLRPYQQECIQACVDKFLKENVRRQAVSLPVGSGKTVIFSNLIQQIPPPQPDATKVLVIAHRQELLHQAYRQISSHVSNKGLIVEIDQGSKIAKGNGDVIIGSVQTLGRPSTLRLAKYNPDEFKAIIIDEAHHATAASYRRILEYFNADTKDSKVFVWGCSATLCRYDGIALSSVFDEITFHRDFLDMIKEKWLCSFRVTTVKTEHEMPNIKSVNNDFDVGSLAQALDTPTRNQLVVQIYASHAKDRKSTLVFAVNKAHVNALTEMFREYGIEAHGIISDTRSHIRTEILERFRRREFPVLVNCGIITEGTDIPQIDCIIMSRPTKSPVLFTQMLGRGMRLAPDKEDCLVLDFVDSYSKIPDVQTVPTLFGMDPMTDFNNQTVFDIEEMNNEIGHKTREADEGRDFSLYTQTIRECEITSWDNPFEFVDDCSGIGSILQHTTNAWVNVGPDSYVLNLVNGKSLRIDKGGDGIYRVKLRQKFVTDDNHWTKTDYLKIETESLVNAVRGADTWVKNMFNHMTICRSISRLALWRREPATDSQKRFLHGLANNWTLKVKEDKMIKSHKIKKSKNEFLREGSLSALSLSDN